MVKERARILVVGGGYVGMYTALRLQKKLKREIKRGQVEITVVSPDPYMTYQPFLPEAAAGLISPRHVVVPLRRVLDRCRVVIGEATAIDHGKRTATLSTLATELPPHSPRFVLLSHPITLKSSGRETAPYVLL